MNKTNPFKILTIFLKFFFINYSYASSMQGLKCLEDQLKVLIPNSTSVQETASVMQKVFTELNKTGTYSLAKLRLQNGNTVKLYQSDHFKFPTVGEVSEANLMAISKYEEAYKTIPININDYFKSEFKKISKHRITHIVISNRNSNKNNIVGYGMLIDGTKRHDEIEILPIERHVPEFNFRINPLSKSANDMIMEITRLSAVKNEANLKDLLFGLAEALKIKYPDQITPNDLRIFGMVLNTDLVKYYQKFGFKISNGPDNTGDVTRWVVEIQAKEILRRYGNKTEMASKSIDEKDIKIID